MQQASRWECTAVRRRGGTAPACTSPAETSSRALPLHARLIAAAAARRWRGAPGRASAASAARAQRPRHTPCRLGPASAQGPRRPVPRQVEAPAPPYPWPASLSRPLTRYGCTHWARQGSSGGKEAALHLAFLGDFCGVRRRLRRGRGVVRGHGQHELGRPCIPVSHLHH